MGYYLSVKQNLKVVIEHAWASDYDQILLIKGTLKLKQFFVIVESFFNLVDKKINSPENLTVLNYGFPI